MKFSLLRHIFETGRILTFIGLTFGLKTLLKIYAKIIQKEGVRWLIAIPIGAVIYHFFINFLWDKLLEKVMGLHPLGQLDQMWIYDKPGQQSNVATLLCFERFEARAMQEFI